MKISSYAGFAGWLQAHVFTPSGSLDHDPGDTLSPSPLISSTVRCHVGKAK